MQGTLGGGGEVEICVIACKYPVKPGITFEALVHRRLLVLKNFYM